MKNKVLIMTPLSAEFMAISRHLSEKSSIVHEGAAYELGKFQTSNGNFQVIVGEPGMRNASMAVATEKAINYFQPQIAILCGIAGGIKDVNVGDVVVAKSAFDYDSGKESDDGFLPRPVEYQFSDELLAHAQLIQREDNWKSRTLDGAQDASIFIASVAAGDKVISAVNNATFDRIQKYLSHCKFLEMEAAGFGFAIQRHRHVHAIVVRGISDMCFNKTEADDKDWQPMAADRAAAFTFELISQIKEEFLLMDAKTIAKQVVDLLFPILKLNSVKEAGNEFKEAIDGSIKELWEIVKPWFIEEIPNEDTELDAHVAVKIALRKEMQKNLKLKEQVEKILQKKPAGLDNESFKKMRVGKIKAEIVNFNQADTINQKFDNRKGRKK